MRNLYRYIGCGALLLLVTACQSSPPPKGVKIGKPYVIDGKTYYPAYDPTYDETGIASWYGPGFHGKDTATGETFDKHDLTAAHPTLPMPSLVRVTNLENGRTLVVRVNDRGPFAKGRIIDLSKESAQRLGIHGLAKVRVQYLARESEQYIAAAAEGREIDMFAYNDRLEAQKDSSILAATAPSDQSFIIEESNAGAAPIVSVNGNDLPDASAKRSGVGLVSKAWADEIATPTTHAPQRGGEVILRAPNMVRIDPPATPSLAPPVALSSSAYYVQIGSFSQPDNAETLRRKMSALVPVEVRNAELSGHQWWRLVAGPFGGEEEAALALRSIRDNGAPEARLIKP